MSTSNRSALALRASFACHTLLASTPKAKKGDWPIPPKPVSRYAVPNRHQFAEDGH
jgi:hypothetical protein